jgi:hypothetical protein
VRARSCAILHEKMHTEVVVLQVGDNFFEIVFAERCKYLLLVFSADHDVADSSMPYFISFYIEFINRIFYYIV